MSVLTQVKITVALMPTALTPLEVMTAHVKLDIQEMDTYVMVNLVFVQRFSYMYFYSHLYKCMCMCSTCIALRVLVDSLHRNSTDTHNY